MVLAAYFLAPSCGDLLCINDREMTVTTSSQAALAALIDERIKIVHETLAAVADPTQPTLSAALLATYIDHTLLKPDAQAEQIRRLCEEARTYDFASVCINPTWVARCAELLAGSHSKVCTVVGFPLGATLSAVKASETTAVIELGAQEVDMVLNVGRLKSGDLTAVYTDIAGVVEAAHRHNVLVKVIIETFLLSEEEKIAAATLTQAAGADFVKTSTGFNGGGATPADVRLLRLTVGPTMGVKAAGGVRNAADAAAMIAAGATRLGASAGVQIMQSLQAGASPTAVTKEGY